MSLNFFTLCLNLIRQQLKKTTTVSERIFIKNEQDAGTELVWLREARKIISSIYLTNWSGARVTMFLSPGGSSVK